MKKKVVLIVIDALASRVIRPAVEQGRLPCLAAVIQAAAPILTVVLAMRIDPSQRVHGLRLVGVAVGFVGVALLVGVQEGSQLVGSLTGRTLMVAIRKGTRAVAKTADEVDRHVGLDELPPERPAVSVIAGALTAGCNRVTERHDSRQE